MNYDDALTYIDATILWIEQQKNELAQLNTQNKKLTPQQMLKAKCLLVKVLTEKRQLEKIIVE